MRARILPNRVCPPRTGEEVNDRGVEFLKLLYQNCNKGFIEYRPLPPEAGHRKWIPLDDIELPDPPDGKHIYFGVATRAYGEGKRTDIEQIPAV